MPGEATASVCGEATAVTEVALGEGRALGEVTATLSSAGLGEGTGRGEATALDDGIGLGEVAALGETTQLGELAILWPSSRGVPPCIARKMGGATTTSGAKAAKVTTQGGAKAGATTLPKGTPLGKACAMVAVICAPKLCSLGDVI